MAAGGAARRDFFISYASVDRRWAEWIAQRLVEAGYSVELDIWEWEPGGDFVAAMQSALHRADRVIAVYTDAYFSRPYAQAEHRGAFAAMLGGGPARIIPVRVEECEVPELYRSLIRIELVGLDEAEAVHRLLGGVAGPAGPPALPVAYPGGRAASAAVRAAAGAPAPLPPGARPGDGPVSLRGPHRPLPPGRGSASLPAVWNIPPRNPFFTGRDALLDEIGRRLRREGGRDAAGWAPVAIVPLQGMSGVGKTQLAVEYAHRHAGDYALAWWVDASSPASAAADLAALADALGLPAGEQRARPPHLLWRVLAEFGEWLLVYDNVEDPAALAELRPPPTGHLLMTSRSPASSRFAFVLEVAEFDRAESLDLLRRRCPTLGAEDAARVAAALGDLPLAVEQAGCYLAETGMSAARYLRLLAARPAAAGLADPTLDRHPGLAAVLAASVARLETACPPAVALLRQMAFLATAPLPFAPAPPAGPRAPAGAGDTDDPGDTNDPDDPADRGVRIGDAATTGEVARQLAGLGLARRGPGTLAVHGLVQALLRDGMTEPQRLAALAAARRLLATAAPGDPASPASWPAYALLVPHAMALLSHLDAAGTAAGSLPPAAAGQSTDQDGGREAGRQAGRAEAGREEAGRERDPGVDPEPFRTLLIAVAMYHHCRGQHQAGRDLAERLHRRWVAMLGADHPHTLAAGHRLAQHLHDLGATARARALHEDTFARRRRVLGDDHPQTLSSAADIARDLRDRGRYQEARALDADTLARRRRVLGENHPHTLNSAHNLVTNLLHLREHKAARALAEDTLARQQAVLGEDHPHALATAALLGRALSALGDLAGARSRYEDTLGRMRRVLGDDHPGTLRCATRLADVLADLGEHPAARALHRDTLARMRRVLGDSHPSTLAAAYRLARALERAGDDAGARALYEDTLARQRETLGPDHPESRQTGAALALLAARRGGPPAGDEQDEQPEQPASPV